ncbi:MAG: DNA-3-methyladenine glycosylase [Phycisphaeraceae bacterium]
MAEFRPLPRSFYERDVLTLAPLLLGKMLGRTLADGTRLAGRIVEVEAYLGAEDKAAHTFKNRRTARNASMFLPAGHAYVYFTYGMHYCLNVVADRLDHPTACLIRAIEPVLSLDVMRQNRANKIPVHRLRDTDLCSGPAKLAQALAIDTTLDGLDMTTDPQLYLALPSEEDADRVPADRIVTRPRVGVGYAGEWAEKPYRFYIAGNRHVSCK